MRVPKDWISAEIGQVADINLRSLSANTDPSYRFRYLDISSVNKGCITWPSNHITFSESPSRARRVVSAGDVLMSMVRPNLQGFALMRDDVHDVIASTGFAVLSPNDRCDASFLFQSLFSENLASQISRLLAGSGYPAISSSEVEQLLLAVPNRIAEQRKIAAILSTWDDALEKLDALIAAKERRMRGLMQQLLTGKRRLSAFRKRQWTSLRMAAVLERVFRPAEIDGSRPLALVSLRRRCGGLFRRPEILASEYKTQDLHELKAGDFLISKRQVVHGAWALVNAEFEDALVSKEYAILVNRAPDVLNMRFFAWLSKTPRMLRLARVSSNGVHIEKLIFDPDVFLRESIRVPSDVAEQEAIANILDASGEELGLLREQRAALDLQKRGLMQQLLTGKVRVRP